MLKTSTPNDVLKEQSGELAPKETENLDASISAYPELEEFSDAVKQLGKEIPSLLLQPSERPLKNIMEFIRKDSEKN